MNHVYRLLMVSAPCASTAMATASHVPGVWTCRVTMPRLVGTSIVTGCMGAVVCVLGWCQVDLI